MMNDTTKPMWKQIVDVDNEDAALDLIQQIFIYAYLAGWERSDPTDDQYDEILAENCYLDFVRE